MKIFFRRWTNGADTVRTCRAMCRLSHPVRTGGARLSTGSRAIAAEDSVLEFPGQRGGHQTLLLFGERKRGRIPAWRTLLPVEERQRSSTNRWAIHKLRVNYLFSICFRIDKNLSRFLLILVFIAGIIRIYIVAISNTNLYLIFYTVNVIYYLYRVIKTIKVRVERFFYRVVTAVLSYRLYNHTTECLFASVSYYCRAVAPEKSAVIPSRFSLFLAYRNFSIKYQYDKLISLINCSTYFLSK